MRRLTRVDNFGVDFSFIYFFKEHASHCYVAFYTSSNEIMFGRLKENDSDADF